MHIGGEFAGDFRGGGVDWLFPAKMVCGRNDQRFRFESALDFGGRMDGERTAGGQLAEEPPFDDGVGRNDFGVENVAVRFEGEGALGFENFWKTAPADGVILQVNVTTAALAHGGLRAEGNFQFRAAFEAGDALFFRRVRPRFFLRGEALARLARGRNGDRTFCRTVETPVRGSICGCPQCGQATEIRSCWLAWHSKTPCGGVEGSTTQRLEGVRGLGRFGGARGRAGGDLIGVDLGLADERDAFLHGQFRGANVAKQLGLGFDFDFFPSPGCCR